MTGESVRLPEEIHTNSGLVAESADKTTLAPAFSKLFGVLQGRKNRSLIGLCFLLLLPIWIFGISPQLTKIPSNFSYFADIISLDNIFDETKGEFVGDVRSVSKFSYVTQKQNGSILQIKNIFNVRSVAGDPIFSVSRLYGIDSITRRHVPELSDTPRSGYLFAPTQIKKNQSFTYWHVNYHGPAVMNFVAEESLFGLPVYRYESSYEHSLIDQTKNLANLPNVGITRGVEVEPSVQLWIEPVTGMLIKYTDKSTAYFYDLATHKRLVPWNKFTNTFQRSSVKEHVQMAQKLKIKYLLINKIIPSMLGVLGIVILFMPMTIPWISISLFGGIVVMGWYVNSMMYPKHQIVPIKIGISRWVPKGNHQYDENIQGFKDALTQAGYIEEKDVIYQLEVADATADKLHNTARMFKDNSFDLIFSQTTPGTAILKEEITTIPIVFSIVTYPVEAGIVHSLLHSENNLVGTRNWVPISEQLSNFRALVPAVKSIGFVHRTGEANSTIQLKEMRAIGKPLNISIVEIQGKNLSELTLALQSAKGIDSIFSACDTLVQGEAENTIISYARAHVLPSFSCNNTGPAKGDLIGTVADFYQIGKLAGEKAALILDGASPSSLETSTVARPYLYINQKTADQLGVNIPQDLLSKAKEVIH